MDAVAERAMDMIAQRDWVAIREVVHPYIRWTRSDGSLLRGRLNLIASVEDGRAPLPPESVELRDGQIYRWVEPAG
jgi:hypothetical protein